MPETPETPPYVAPVGAFSFFPFSPHRCACCLLWKDDFERSDIGPYYEEIPGLSIVDGKARITSPMEVFRPKTEYDNFHGTIRPIKDFYFPSYNLSLSKSKYDERGGVGNGEFFGKMSFQHHFTLETDGEVLLGPAQVSSPLSFHEWVGLYIGFNQANRTVKIWSMSTSVGTVPGVDANGQNEYVLQPHGQVTSQKWKFVSSKVFQVYDSMPSPPWRVRVCYSCTVNPGTVPDNVNSQQLDNTYRRPGLTGAVTVWVNDIPVANCQFPGLTSVNDYLVPNLTLRDFGGGTYFTVDDLEVHISGMKEPAYWVTGSYTGNSFTSFYNQPSGRDNCPDCSTSCWIPFGYGTDHTQRIQVEVSGFKFFAPNTTGFHGASFTTQQQLSYDIRNSTASCCESRNGTFILDRINMKDVGPLIPLSPNGTNGVPSWAQYLYPFYGLPASPRDVFDAIVGCSYYRLQHDFGCGLENMFVVFGFGSQSILSHGLEAGRVYGGEGIGLSEYALTRTGDFNLINPLCIWLFWQNAETHTFTAMTSLEYPYGSEAIAGWPGYGFRNFTPTDTHTPVTYVNGSTVLGGFNNGWAPMSFQIPPFRRIVPSTTGDLRVYEMDDVRSAVFYGVEGFACNDENQTSDQLDEAIQNGEQNFGYTGGILGNTSDPHNYTNHNSGGCTIRSIGSTNHTSFNGQPNLIIRPLSSHYLGQ